MSDVTEPVDPVGDDGQQDTGEDLVQRDENFEPEEVEANDVDDEVEVDEEDVEDGEA